MSHALARRLPDRPDIDRRTLLWAAFLLNVELLLSGVYVLWHTARGGTVTLATLLFPYVWINVAVWAVVRTDPPAVGRRTRRVAIALGAGYFLLLAGLGGVLGPGHLLHGHTHGTGLSVHLTTLPPGWGPMVLYTGPVLALAVTPYKVAGYAALAYLVYATVVEASGAAGALVGLFSCVSCTWPILGQVVTGVLGSGSAVAAFATGQPYLASTLVFLSAVALLSWRPSLA
jgi:hypothetical protein